MDKIQEEFKLEELRSVEWRSEEQRSILRLHETD